MIRAVLFDLDGTLHDRDSSVRQLIRHQYQRFQSALAHIPDEIYLARFMALDTRGYTPKAAVYAQLVGEFALTTLTAEQLEGDFFAHYPEHTLGFPAFRTVLEELRQRGLKLGLITNGRTIVQQQKIKAMGIERHFDTILISEAEGLRKPDAQIFQLALAHLAVNAVESIYVGDHPQVDIEGAQKAGLRAVWKRDPYWGGCPTADWVIEDLLELLPICP